MHWNAWFAFLTSESVRVKNEIVQLLEMLFGNLWYSVLNHLTVKLNTSVIRCNRIVPWCIFTAEGHRFSRNCVN